MDFLATLPPEIRDVLIDHISQESPLTEAEYEQLKVDQYNDTPGNLQGVDCPICHNKGDVMILDPETLERKIRECKCMAQRRSLRYLERSGLSKVLDIYSWDAWVVKEPWQRTFVDEAKAFARNPKGWFMASGKPGTGKTHMCTAICGDLLRSGYEVRYLLWRDFTTQAKALLTEDEEYRELVTPYKTVPVLYLDDLFKTGRGQDPTVGDCNLAFELINARYADPTKITIISTELTVDRINDIDEAIGSRIFERAKENYFDLSRRKNWRLA